MNTQRARQALLEVVGVVAPDVEPEELDPNGSLREQADLDSVDFLEIVSQLSDALQEDIPTTDYPKLDTFNSAVAYLASRMQ